MSRVHFCEKCYANDYPFDGQYYAVYGGTLHDIRIGMWQAPLKRDECPPCGFTPHLFTIDRILPSGNLQVRISCGMEGCDCHIVRDETTNKFQYAFVRERYILMTKKEWEAWENFTDSGYKL